MIFKNFVQIMMNYKEKLKNFVEDLISKKEKKTMLVSISKEKK